MESKKMVQLLTLLFYLLVAGAMVAYFALPTKEWFYYLGFGAVGVRILTYILRQIV